MNHKQEAVLLHFRCKGSGGNYDYGGLKSSEAKHLHPNGKNPGDMIEANPVRHKPWLRKGKTKAWMSNPGHPFTHTCTGKPQNLGDFWEINTKPFPGVHFAVFPETLCERPIKAGCPPDGIVLDPFAAQEPRWWSQRDLVGDISG